MKRHLIIPLVMADGLAAVLLAAGLGAWFAPGVSPFDLIAARGLALPLIVIGAVGMLVCGPLMLRWFIASMRERGR